MAKIEQRTGFNNSFAKGASSKLGLSPEDKKETEEQYKNHREKNKSQLRQFLILETSIDRPKHLKIENLIEKLESLPFPISESCFKDLKCFLKIFFKDQLFNVELLNTKEGFRSLIYRLKKEYLKLSQEFQEYEFFELTESPMVHLENYEDKDRKYCALIKIRREPMGQVTKIHLGTNPTFFLHNLIKYGEDSEDDNQNPIKIIRATELNKHYTTWNNKKILNRTAKTGDADYSRMWQQVPKEIEWLISKTGTAKNTLFSLNFDNKYCKSSFSVT